MAKLKVVVCWKYDEERISHVVTARMLEEAFARREDMEVHRSGEIKDADLVFNALPLGSTEKGRITVWWDSEACSYQCPQYFDADIVLAPYTCEGVVYPEGKTYLFPNATDPNFFYYWPCEPEYDIGFVGKEVDSRETRRELLDYLEQTDLNLLRVNNVERGVPVSQLLSKARVILQCAGEMGGGVLEERFFMAGLIAPVAADITPNNRADMEWAAIPDHHFIAYENAEELVAKVKSMIATEGALETMRLHATANYLTRHTYDVRVRDLLEQIGFLKGPGLPDYHAPRQKSGCPVCDV